MANAVSGLLREEYGKAGVHGVIIYVDISALKVHVLTRSPRFPGAAGTVFLLLFEYVRTPLFSSTPVREERKRALDSTQEVLPDPVCSESTTCQSSDASPRAVSHSQTYFKRKSKAGCRLAERRFAGR